MRTLCALAVGFVVWNGLAPAGWADVNRAIRPEGEALGMRRQPLHGPNAAYLTIHGRLQFIGFCLPGETGLWMIQVGEQSLRLRFVNDELVTKAHAFGSQPVSIQGYLKNGEVTVESLQLDERKEATPEVRVQLTGKLNFPETLAPWDQGLSMGIDGQLFWLHVNDRPELRKQAERLADALVVVKGRLELRPVSGGTVFIVHVIDIREAFMK
jgi:hypothetical protein